jgi:hypothetical protein
MLLSRLSLWQALQQQTLLAADEEGPARSSSWRVAPDLRGISWPVRSASSIAMSVLHDAGDGWNAS